MRSATLKSSDMVSQLGGLSIFQNGKDLLHGHLVDLSVVESFNVPKSGNIPVVEDIESVIDVP